jgi:ABC-2 type transport system ATP-binding protein
MTAEMAIEVIGLEKSYGPVRVLNGMTLRAHSGMVLSLLGRNGAGKTTTIRILSTLSRPDAGLVRVAGFDVARQRREVRRHISLTGQFVAIDELQTGEENLRMMGQLTGLPATAARARARELLEAFELTDAAGRLVARYSGGMRRRLDLAAGLVGRPSVIFLDEPTAGLDLPSRMALWRAIADLARSGVTIFLTTQYLEEADQLADRIAVLNDGLVVADGTPDELKKRVGGHRLDLTLADAAACERVSAALGGSVTLADTEHLTLSVATDGTAAQVRGLLDQVDPERTLVERFAVHSATLDDVFLALTGHSAAAAPEAANV